MAIEIFKEIVPKVNYKSELEGLKKLDVSSYSGYSSKRLIFVSLVNSNNVLVYDLTKCSRNYYYNFLKIIRRRCC